jgi:hypothetical protein
VVRLSWATIWGRESGAAVLGDNMGKGEWCSCPGRQYGEGRVMQLSWATIWGRGRGAAVLGDNMGKGE